ncbi:MAG: vanadium-dependent haloperoxidase [Synechococcales cyanobacterium CRU_2_2]|nr:vanadium-dependent haloperoxidase [Synechococcales cyanobacterium CRU_2_2]
MRYPNRLTQCFRLPVVAANLTVANLTRFSLAISSVLILGGQVQAEETWPHPVPPNPLQDTQNDTPKDAVLRWNETTLKAISLAKLGPTPTSRAIGIVTTSMYDAWAAYDQRAIGTTLGNSLQVSAEHINDSNKQTALSFAAYRTLSDLFPAQTELFNQLMTELGYDPQLATTETTSAAGIGNYVSQQLIASRRADGSNQLGGYADISNYQPLNRWNDIQDPAHWQPLSLDGGQKVQTFLTPHWGKVTSFALTSGNQFLPPPPEPFQDESGQLNPDFVAQALQILEYNAELTDREKVIAEYWADGPGTILPPGHWQQFGQTVSIRDQLSLDDNVKLFFALGNAMLDSGIAAWDAKVTYDYVRPISAIRYLAQNNLLPTDHANVRLNAAGQTEIYAWAGPNRGSDWILGSEWLPYQALSFVTPPFGEYVSGHSTYSAAGAEILQRFTGSEAFGLCHLEPANSSRFESATPNEPVELCWDTFTAAADQAGMSRLYGGIHFADGDIQGRVLGRSVAGAVWDKTQFYINGGQTTKVPEPSAGLGFAIVLWGMARRSSQPKKIGLKP